ncbi:MAG: HD domain-containing protein [Thermoplasmata archaeon]|nr:HD domain-containing protein [Thermoplasmata archaeon]
MARRSSSDVRKSIFDPVHGTIVLEGAALDLVGHPAFQRLWGIRQTGFAHLVFPGANHTRLEHSLGVYWVARQLAATLALAPEDAEAVAAGGLLHDAGHPPFSHSLDGPMREVLGHGHESVSREWIIGRGPSLAGDDSGFDRTLRRHGIDPGFVADLVDPPGGRERNRFLRSLLHGAIDADRIDYLQRDAHYTGVAHGAIDASRLMDTARQRRGRLVFAEKGRSAVEGFLVGRSLMYASVYYHKTVRAAEMMAQASVERVPDFPDAARPIFAGTDGDLVATLRRVGGTSADLVQGLLERRLYKRAAGTRALSPKARRAWRVLATRPERRRQLEDSLAEVIGGAPGSVLIDLSGLDARETAGGDWQDVGILEGSEVTHPFRPPSLWSVFAGRPPSPWPVSLYVHPTLRGAAERRLPATLREAPGI